MSGMIGLDETLKELRTQCPKLKDVMKAENLVYAATAGSVLLNEMENGLTATGVGAKVVELTSFASNAKQFYEFYSKAKGLEVWQQEFINALPKEIIKEYFPVTLGFIGNINTDIAHNLHINKEVTITLLNDRALTLHSISLTRLLGGTAFSIALSVACAMSYVHFQSLTPDSAEKDKPLTEWITLFLATAPLGNIYENTVGLIYKQTANLFEAISTAIKYYENKIHYIPDNLLKIAEFFMKNEYNQENRLKILELKNEEKISRLSVKVDVLENKMELLAGTNIVDSSKQKTLTFSDQASGAAVSTPLEVEDEESVQETDTLLSAASSTKGQQYKSKFT